MVIAAVNKESTLVKDKTGGGATGVKHSSIRLTGLDCADCAAKLEKKLNRLEGVRSAKVNFGAAKLSVEHELNLDKIIKAIEESGYGVERSSTEGQRQSARVGDSTEDQNLSVRVSNSLEDQRQSVRVSNSIEGQRPPGGEIIPDAQLTGNSQFKYGKSYWQKNQKILLTLISGMLLAMGFLLSLFNAASGIVVPLYLLAMLTGGFYVARTGFYALKTFTLDMNFLMTVAAIGAAAIGEWLEGATVVFLFSLGNALQAYTMEKTRNSIRALMDLAPQEALVRRNGIEMCLPLAEIAVGDVLIVKPGERIAMDGRVIAGTSGVNQASITGESLPVEKRPGSEVYAGTLNEQGSLDIEVTKLVEDTTLAKIIQMVEEAQGQKAPSQQFVDVFARYYTPLVIAGAVAVAIIPSLVFAQPFIPWFKKALILLVISCPCALVISTPVSIVASIGSAARKGVLIKGGAYLEAAGALEAIAFDKTGTLTTGRPEVTDIVPAGGRKPEEIMAIAAAIENRSQHPLAQAILRSAEAQGIQVRESTGFESLTGKGAKCHIEGKIYYIGSPRLFEELRIHWQAQGGEITRLQKQGKTVMLIGDPDQLYGLVAVADVVRESSVEAIRKLQGAGIKKLVMLTGDNRETAQAIAKEVGIDEFRAELLPEDKLTAVKDLLARYGRVGMVGDGVNDAPALATATVGIAMGGAGTDTALETADIALMADDLSKLPFAVKISRKALRVIKQNIAFALVLKGLFLVLTFMGMANLWMAVFADTGAALLVIANGMRLFKVG